MRAVSFITAAFLTAAFLITSFLTVSFLIASVARSDTPAAAAHYRPCLPFPAAGRPRAATPHGAEGAVAGWDGPGGKAVSRPRGAHGGRSAGAALWQPTAGRRRAPWRSAGGPVPAFGPGRENHWAGPAAIRAGHGPLQPLDGGLCGGQRPGRRCETSWSTQPLPSGSLKVRKEP
ncbi:hypothetical protein SAV14893_088120 [Streptomyces avermitilis]|uniref:Uncharacterized protein n=1 Tax=Streptomyces avermitilis TaxID=33903 RepID=A0A4D4MCT5_STRAX|nr:hypothetical protein SAVMC3_08450 [Streptomyces avermitilis]GDY69419.1 hypothetical protein SAV14893_088120 [Streptomyces avermitilis]GDY79668.1 hypothetical protein SAV31267_091530 [Streptomyces avermitilis]